MNVVIYRVRVFDFSKPLQGTWPSRPLVGRVPVRVVNGVWYMWLGGGGDEEERKTGYGCVTARKKASGKRKKNVKPLEWKKREKQK